MEYEYKGLFVKFSPDFCSFFAYYGSGLSFFTNSRSNLVAHLAADLGCPYEIAEGAVNHHYGPYV